MNIRLVISANEIVVVGIQSRDIELEYTQEISGIQSRGIWLKFNEEYPRIKLIRNRDGKTDKQRRQTSDRNAYFSEINFIFYLTFLKTYVEEDKINFTEVCV